MWNLKANCPIGKWFAWCPVIEFPTSQKCKKHHSAAHGGNLFNILNAENRDVRSRSARMDKMKKLWLHFCNVTWHLVKWSPTIRQPILVRFGQSQVKQSRFNAFGGIQEPFLLNSFKIRWCMTTILDYFGLYPFEIVTPTYTRLLEAVITCRPPMVSKIFIDCENFSFWFWELAVTTLLSVRSMPTCQGEVGTN